MPMVFIESYGEFCARHGDTPLFLNERYLLEDGAQSDGRNSHEEPPTDPQELARLRLEYTRGQRDKLVAKYHHDKGCIGEQLHFHSMGAGPMPEDGWKLHLKRLAKRIERLNERVAQLEQQATSNQQDDDYESRRGQQRTAAQRGISALMQFPHF